MFSTDDTIVAIATPNGRGGIGVVRISGSAALRIGLALTAGTHLEPRHATLARVGQHGIPRPTRGKRSSRSALMAVRWSFVRL
jgi:tRNA U34 5-carboxymethylaminomethyl modifying GTPase MnmE/TrmE